MKLLVAGVQRIFLVDAESHDVQVLKSIEPCIYGLSWFHDGQALCVGCWGLPGPRTLEECIDAERGWIAVGERVSDKILASPHQILGADDTLIVANTGRNCLTLFRKQDLYYRHHWLDDIRWDRLGNGNDFGSHFNSVMLHDQQLYVLAHNFERGSYLLVLSWPDLNVQQRLPCPAKWAHNVWARRDGSIFVCDSRHSRIVDVVSGDEFWSSGDKQTITRGLACRDNYVFVGKSEILERDQRQVSDGGVWIVDRQDATTLDYIPLPRSGCVQEIRIVEGDECHHNHPLLCPLVPDIRATERYRAEIRSGRSACNLSASVKESDERIAAKLPFAAAWRQQSVRSVLSSPWQIRTGYFHVIEPELRPAAHGLSIAVLAGVSVMNVKVAAHLDVTTSAKCHAGVLARYRGPEDGNAYLAMLAHCDPQATVDLWKHAGEGWLLLDSVSVASKMGVLELQVEDTTLTVHYEGVQVIRRDDDDIPGLGTVGLRTYGARVLDFRVDPLLAGTEQSQQSCAGRSAAA